LENPLFSRIQRQLTRNQRFIYQLGSSYALLGLNMVAMFVLTPTLLRSLGKESYGIWLVLFGITNFFNLSSFGFGQTFTLELIKKQGKQKEINKLVNTLLFSLLFFALATFPIFLFVQFALLGSVIKISPTFLPEASRSFWLVYIIFFLNFISQLPFNILFARHKLALRNGIEMGRVALNFCATLFVLHKSGGILQLSAATLIVTLVYLIGLFVASKINMDYELKYEHFSYKQFKKFLRPSFHFFLIGLAMQIIVYSDSLLVSSLQSSALVAIYTVALRIPDTCMRLIFKIADVKIPKITTLYGNKDWFRLWLLHNRLLWLTFGAAAGIAIGLMLFGPFVIQLWMGKDFELNYMLLIIFSLNMFFQCMMHVPAIFLQSMGMHERSSIFAIVGAPVAVIAAWYLSKIFGLEGIAIAMCGTQFLVGVLVIPQLYFFFRDMTRDKKFNLNLLQVK
jgi:O-antigen/teichoic acid export membrane protein